MTHVDTNPMVALEPIPVPECWNLLAGRRVGRLGLLVDGKPAIFPVNYVIDGESILFRTAEGTALNQASLRQVAFEVDDVDDVANRWSVLLQGFARDIGDAIDASSQRRRDLDLSVCAPEPRPRWIHITPTSVTGRRLRVVPDAL